ncbi:hypothetical protein TraAM80_07061 [Trypanosoma rangeli]|uniref:Uncharacterized protein n=1 Tax=Trypanosoma rangeli TaxID=5698 RepID=A0A3R7KTY6_TRYRA|nr:uncharacterized protein TraAM80_07061 [Trypanosoma rangeli]RNF01316.1 hypothetical protein TraAM80_07061 [Trypanosoma rangeli]|eukprot:RNF01316.1 hypothetical protein TraAM80_07061 [Trypanosoma rangeli]
MIGYAVVQSAEDVIGAARSLAVKGEHVEAVYAAHERLEEDLANLPVMIAELRNPTSSCLDPWVGVSATLESLCHEVELCLQLFSISVRVQRYKALRTVAALYDQQKSSADRLRGFFLIISASFTVDATVTPMPAVILRKFAQVIRPFDASQAAEWLNVGIHSMLDAARSSQVPASCPPLGKLSSLSVFAGNGAAAAQVKAKGAATSLMVCMLTLLIKCRAEAGEATMEVHTRESELREFLEDDVLKSLMQFEGVCATTMQKKKQHIQARMERRSATKRATPAPKAERVDSKDTWAGTGGCATSYLQRLRQNLEHLWDPEWRRHPARIVMVVAGVILLLLLTRLLVSLVARGMQSLKRTPYGAKKRLTL